MKTTIAEILQKGWPNCDVSIENMNQLLYKPTLFKSIKKMRNLDLRILGYCSDYKKVLLHIIVVMNVMNITLQKSSSSHMNQIQHGGTDWPKAGSSLFYAYSYGSGIVVTYLASYPGDLASFPRSGKLKSVYAALHVHSFAVGKLYHHSMFHNPTAAVNLFHVGKQYLTFCKA